MIYGCLASIIFCGYIIYDTDNLIKRYSYDEYIWASVSLYLDIINLFLSLMTIFRAADSWRWIPEAINLASKPLLNKLVIFYILSFMVHKMYFFFLSHTNLIQSVCSVPLVFTRIWIWKILHIWKPMKTLKAISDKSWITQPPIWILFMNL